MVLPGFSSTELTFFLYYSLPLASNPHLTWLTTQARTLVLHPQLLSPLLLHCTNFPNPPGVRPALPVSTQRKPHAGLTGLGVKGSLTSVGSVLPSGHPLFPGQVLAPLPDEIPYLQSSSSLQGPPLSHACWGLTTVSLRKEQPLAHPQC